MNGTSTPIKNAMTPQSTSSGRPATGTKTKPRRSKVDHLYWVPEADAAKALGILEVPAICRRAWVATSHPEIVAPNRQGRATNLSSRPCRECVRIAEARWNRELERKRRG